MASIVLDSSTPFTATKLVDEKTNSNIIDVDGFVRHAFSYFPNNPGRF
jgi:hypothetical protein